MALPELPTLLVLAAIALGAFAILRLRELSSLGRDGRLLAVDEGTAGRLLTDPVTGLRGRPDEIRALPDGRWVPIEWKTRPAPRHRPFDSHRVQLLAYLRLCESVTGRAPPYGVLRYGDGVEHRIPWDAEGRAELSAWLAAAARPYDGSATPSPGKCRNCRWREGCDARAA